ncbi:nucleoporin Nup120/160-domain-containing protein [Collybia nuda]|uniref:Nucleoporin Nup120/160-domain-containing protein n=1 Tax=Collybia nuda TaxID=64659 RepID=A0A9P5YHN4_9AGAR|nr:nucleoporin Nup120/160-domain-containing protein [Collybia nuda]
MDGGFLIATQLSSLFQTQPVSIPLHTARQGVPLPPPPHDSDPPAEHATYSSLLHTPVTGTILLRVLHGGLIIELVSLSTEVPPIRIVFPAVVIPSPAVFLWESSELHVIAVTNVGSLYRVVIPVGMGRELWRDQADNVWPCEYLISNVAGLEEALVHVQGTHCVAIALPNGVLMRLETDYVGTGSGVDWMETVFQHSSFLSSLTSFLPAINNSPSNGSDIISMATHPWPTDVGHIWTLSRDRTLRFWKAKIGCVTSKTLSPLVNGKESSPAPGTSVNGNKLLLAPTHQTLLRVFSTDPDEDHIYVLAFIPTISSPSSGGSFRLLNTPRDQLYEIGTIECSTNTAHCHLQDFMVIGNWLYTLWDRQGQSIVEKTIINVEDGTFNSAPWHVASYAPEPELTPAYLEEQLLSPGSLTEKFYEAIMRPGMFSALTLRTAIDQYTDSCLSLPGPRPPQLSVTYSTLGEHIACVVGCTVNLNRDPKTGAFQHANYWNALKRDWEGFIARCREVERSARWPLVLGAQDQGEIIVVERERVGLLVREDLPVHIWRTLVRQQGSLDPQYDLLHILWTLRSGVGPQTMLNFENRLMDLVHQETAFSYADIIKDQAQRSRFREDLDEGSESWIIGRLQSINDLGEATHAVLDVIGGFDIEVKREEDEVELLLPPPNSDWSRALTTSYIVKSVDARYDLALSLVTLLFFLSEELAEWDPALLAEIFGLYRGVAMLRYVVRQPAGVCAEPLTISGDFLTPDDVASQMRNMTVTRNKPPVASTSSIIDCLLAQSSDTHRYPGSAHRFLDHAGLLQVTSPANATSQEVVFCEKLRSLRFYHVAWELLSWLPRTPGASYVLARLYIDIGRADDASELLEKIAGCFGLDHPLTSEGQQSLKWVLPVVDSQFSFYLHASTLFHNASLVHHEVLFAELAISVAPPVDTSTLWHTIIKGQTDLGLFDEAYASLMATPYETLKQECVSQLAYRMCEDNAVETLMSFNFAGLSDEVQDALAFKARNVDPRSLPSWSKVLYTWYTRRGDYRNAALAMYQRARKVQDLIYDPSTFDSLAEEQLDAYSIAINALSLVDPKNAWIVLPVTPESTHEPRKRRKLSRHIPENRYAPGKPDAEIVHLADIQYDHVLLSAQIDIIQKDLSVLSSAEFLLPPSSIVLRLAQSNRFNFAMATARSLKVDMTDLFTHLTGQCLRLSRNPDAVIQEDTSDWLLTDKVSSWPGTPADRGWRYLRQSLQRHDNAETDFKYTKATLETIMSFDRSSPPPPWLIHILEENHHEYLIRINLRYENLEYAIEHTLSLIRKSDARLARDPPQNSSATWLPYTLIDQVLIAASAQDSSPPRLSELQSEITNRVKRMQKLSQFSQ